MSKKDKKIWDVVSTVLVVLVLVFAVLLVGSRLMGVQVFSIISGSMEPEYPVGSLICVKEIDSREVAVGDVITYVLPSGTPSTHRVIKVSADHEYFYTKGDANEKADTSPVFYKNVIGTPVLTIPYLGYVAYVVQSPPGSYIAISACAVLLLVTFLPDLFKKKPEAPQGTPESEA